MPSATVTSEGSKPATKLGSGSRRMLELDALRGIAAVAVVLFHYSTRYDTLFGHHGQVSFSLPMGHYGVDLFFMLSGFVILMTIERCRDPLAFGYARFVRLYPTFWYCALFTFCFVSWAGLAGQEVSLADALWNVTMVPELFDAGRIDGAYWSLQAEILFYANIALLSVLGLLRKPLRTLCLWLFAAAVVQTLLVAVPQDSAAASLLFKLRTIASLEYIALFGIGIAIYLRIQERIKSDVMLGLLAACIGICCLVQGPFAAIVDTGLSGLFWLAAKERLPWLRQRVLLWLGAISYPLYLIHQNCGYILIRTLEDSGMGPTLAIGVTLTCALTAAWAIHAGIEVPFNLRLKKFKPSGSKVLGKLRAARSA